MAGIVVVGASQGGVHALHKLISGLPADFALPIAAVLHIGSSHSFLPSILTGIGGLTASHAKSGEKLRPGHVFIAPPDLHLVIVDGRLELSRGPRENFARPALDPLFRSAAEAYGPNAIGIVLTGGLNDGTAGLYEIKRRGGVAIVQDPNDAEAPSMPQSALQHVKVDYSLPLAEIPELLIRLSEGKEITKKAAYLPGRLAMEHEHTTAHPIAQTCPECGGAMRQEQLGTLTRFKCHIGHAMTAEVLVAGQVDTLQRELGSVFRTLNERVNLCRDLASEHLERGRTELAEFWRRAAEQAEKREQGIRALVEADWLHPELEVKNDVKEAV